MSKLVGAISQITGRSSITILKNSPESWENGIIDVKTPAGIFFEIKTNSDIKSNTIVGVIGEVSFINEKEDLERIFSGSLPDWNLGTSVSISFWGNKGIMKKQVAAKLKPKKTFSLKDLTPRRILKKIFRAMLKEN
jgi:hypothetical protein